VFADLRTPATLFVVSDHASRSRPFWWDRLDSLAARVTQERWAQFSVQTGLSEWSSANRNFLPPSYEVAAREWLLCEYHGILPEHVDREFAVLEGEYGIAAGQRSMTWDELAKFRTEAEIDVGVHTHRHPVLPLLSNGALGEELEKNWTELRARHSDAMPVVAFPYGFHDERVINVARECGLTNGLSTSNRVFRGGRDDFVVPRLMISRTHTPLRISVLASGARDALRRAPKGIDKTGRPPCRPVV
jgi:peptidoglycan/xylan/chitin deacetylase (PgdA/CDA1 family)